MSTVSTQGKVAYIYNQSTDTWHPIAGATDPSANISWSGIHSFGSSVTFDNVLNAKAGINNFQNPSARDSAIPAPVNGIVCFVRQNTAGAVINEIQYYHNGSWRAYGDNALLSTKNASFTLSLDDAGKTIDVDSSITVNITVPLNSAVPFLNGTQLSIIQTGTGAVNITATSGVDVVSKNNARQLSGRYSAATLVKKSENLWILIGDIKI